MAPRPVSLDKPIRALGVEALGLRACFLIIIIGAAIGDNTTDDRWQVPPHKLLVVAALECLEIRVAC